MNDETAMRIEAWFDGELDPAARAEVEALLERDPRARAHLERLRRLRAALQEAKPVGVGAPVAWNSVRARIEPASTRRGRSWPVPAGLRLAGAAAAALLLGMAVWWQLHRAGSERAARLSTLVELVETDLEGATPIIYIDRPSGWTVVWILEADGNNRG